MEQVTYKIETIEHEGEEIPCLVRNGTQYIDLQSLNLFFDLAAVSADAYESVCQLVDSWLETASTGLEA